MQVITRQRDKLRVSIDLGPKDLDQYTPSIVFHYLRGGQCSSYFITTFMAIPKGQGLCLEGNYWERQDLDPMQVDRCRRFIRKFLELPTQKTRQYTRQIQGLYR